MRAGRKQNSERFRIGSRIKGFIFLSFKPLAFNIPRLFCSKMMTGEFPKKYTAIFAKKGNMVFISHLDLMNLFRRSIRRSGLPFVLTAGFSPRVRISMPQALKLGVESEKEEMTIWLAEEALPEKIKDVINRELPEGIGILEVRQL
ncbi:MAG: TIGR03936 family radical SAM-associated protein [Candidatus Tantalella remota]|nr:TIGR03936 family radical SAM-associated protein [Candidatus Tantalella remota]